MQNGARCFKYIADALEAETLQGQTAQRIVDASKQLISSAQLDAAQLLASLTPEAQQTVRAFFG